MLNRSLAVLPLYFKPMYVYAGASLWNEACPPAKPRTSLSIFDIVRTPYRSIPQSYEQDVELCDLLESTVFQELVDAHLCH